MNQQYLGTRELFGVMEIVFHWRWSHNSVLKIVELKVQMDISGIYGCTLGS